MNDTGSITIGDDLPVGRIGYGAMKLTGDHVWGPYPDRDRAVAMLRGVVDAGVTLIDTADVYGPHTNALLIREASTPTRMTSSLPRKVASSAEGQGRSSRAWRAYSAKVASR